MSSQQFSRWQTRSLASVSACSLFLRTRHNICKWAIKRARRFDYGSFKFASNMSHLPLYKDTPLIYTPWTSSLPKCVIVTLNVCRAIVRLMKQKSCSSPQCVHWLVSVPPLVVEWYWKGDVKCFQSGRRISSHSSIGNSGKITEFFLWALSFPLTSNEVVLRGRRGVSFIAVFQIPHNWGKKRSHTSYSRRIYVGWKQRRETQTQNLKRKIDKKLVTTPR